MKAIGFLATVMLLNAASALAQSAPPPGKPVGPSFPPPETWYNPEAHVTLSVYDRTGASLQFACETITIAKWQADGQPMSGLMFIPSAQPSGAKSVSIIAHQDGEQVTVETEDGSRYVLRPGKGEALTCGHDPADDITF